MNVVPYSVFLSTMSSPTEEMRMQDSLRASSQHTVGAALEDTTTSMPRGGQMLGSSTTISSRVPNSKFAQVCALSHLCSVSPRP